MVFDRMSLKSKTAVVTGAAHGIGKACALALAEAGADVAVIDLKDTVFHTADEIQAMGRKSIPMIADITDEKQINEAIERVTGEWGKLDICFCNAGTFRTFRQKICR